MRTNNSSGCLTAVVSSFSRIILLCAWLARPAMMNAAFSSFIIPCLGFLFLPFTTLMYVLLIQGVGGIQGLDWLWLIVAVVLDIASVGAAGASNPIASLPAILARTRRARGRFARLPTRVGRRSRNHSGQAEGDAVAQDDTRTRGCHLRAPTVAAWNSKEAGAERASRSSRRPGLDSNRMPSPPVR